jgi:NitT/TauT family transport system ATP-binding protein
VRNHNGETVLEGRGLSQVYHSGQGDLAALEDVSLEVRGGEFVAIVGPSGCGKSTLLRILGGLLAPSSGTVHLDGRPLTSPQRQVAYVFQNVNLLPWRTVLRNVLLPLQVARTGGEEAMKRAESVLSLVGLLGFADLYPRQLSGGMAQRVAIARALVAEPEVLLLDEPFGALDALSREQMNLELLRIWRARRVTAVMVTHDLQEAIFLADRVLVMSSRPGRIRAEIQVDLPRPRTLEVMYTEFFGALSRRVREVIREAQGN